MTAMQSWHHAIASLSRCDELQHERNKRRRTSVSRPNIAGLTVKAHFSKSSGCQREKKESSKTLSTLSSLSVVNGAPPPPPPKTHISRDGRVPHEPELFCVFPRQKAGESAWDGTVQDQVAGCEGDALAHLVASGLWSERRGSKVSAILVVVVV